MRFSSGLDFRAAMHWFQSGGSDFAEQSENRIRSYFHAVIRARRRCLPVIAYLDGVAAGFVVTWRSPVTCGLAQRKRALVKFSQNEA